MTRGLAIAVKAMLAIFIFAGSTFALDLNLATGNEKGTYYQFGLNLQQLVRAKGMELGILTSSGSIENLYAVYKKPQTQLGIVQSDVLAFTSRIQSSPTLIRIAEKTKMVFPLYDEEIHILGKKDIADFNSLEGKRVAVGEKGSGTYLTARLLFEVSGVKPKEMVMTGTNEALSSLKAGRIDAMLYVAGLPVKLFNDEVAESDGLALIPATDKEIVRFYRQAKIPAGTYAWQTTEVNTVAVKAVLVSYDFRNLECETVGRFSQILFQNIGRLRETGHPKWKSVDLDFKLKNWEQYDCAKKYLTAPAPPDQLAPVTPVGPVGPVAGSPGEINPIMNAVEEILNR